MYPFYLFVAALIIFLLYNYRQVIKEKLGYHDSDAIFIQSVKDLQMELRGTADAIIEQFEREHQRMERALAKANERIIELEHLLQTAELTQHKATEQSILPDEQESVYINEATGRSRPEAQRIHIVAQMAAHGMDVHEISQATGLGYSEVRLLLSIGNRESGIGNRGKD